MGAATAEEVRHIAQLVPQHCSQVTVVPLAGVVVLEPQPIIIITVLVVMEQEERSESIHGRR
jgi:hypothetical protein